uniref:Mastermind-like transcriptional coactivator 3 n=1 Tax=Haplochromis burtoni TaxID=8153 RepID=A0A3Q3BHZ8_HAPBU
MSWPILCQRTICTTSSTRTLTKRKRLKQLKAFAQQRNKMMQKQQQQAANWSPAAAPTSPYNSAHFNHDKPNSPMMYPPQAFNTPQGPLVGGMAPNNGPKAPVNNYLPHNHMGMMGQQQPNSINQNALSKQQQQQQQTAGMLSYSNTKPLSHFSGSGVDLIGQRMTPPMPGNSQVKNPMMPPYMGGAGGGGQGPGPGQTQGPIPGQTAHLSEEQKRMLLMKQKVLNQNMPYNTMQPHGQVRGHKGVCLMLVWMSACGRRMWLVAQKCVQLCEASSSWADLWGYLSNDWMRVD